MKVILHIQKPKLVTTKPAIVLAPDTTNLGKMSIKVYNID